MKILVANLGSTSFKYRLISFSGDVSEVLTKGGYERVTNYEETLNDCLRQLSDGGHLTGPGDLDGVGFKTVVADGVSGCLELDDEVLEAMARCNDLAPAHNPPYITGVRQFRKALPGVPLVGLFETAFYQWIPEPAKRYAVPDNWYQAGIRRWGFHGASHKFIAERSAELLDRDDIANHVRNLYSTSEALPEFERPLRVVSLHLGGSSSVTGIRNGVAVGNSMGFSPQSGLPQNNRVGDLDSFAVPLAMRRLGLSLDQVEQDLSKNSGLFGLSGISNDLRDIDQAAKDGNAGACLAMDYLVHQARHWMGAYILQMGGIDSIVFTAGIGENRSDLRERICANLEEFGVQICPEANASTKGVEGCISADSSRVRVQVIPANEELVVAREVRQFIQRRNQKN